MKKYLLGAFIMLIMLKPAVGIALVSIFAEGMQTAAAAMANGASTAQIDAAASASLMQRGRGVAEVTVENEVEEEEILTAPPVAKKKKNKEEVFEERVMTLIEKRIQHEQEQQESQRKLADADATARAEKAGIELFDEEFKKKFPNKAQQ